MERLCRWFLVRICFYYCYCSLSIDFTGAVTTGLEYPKTSKLIMQVREAGLLSACIFLATRSALFRVSIILAFLFVAAIGVTDLGWITVWAVSFASVLKLWLFLITVFVFAVCMTYFWAKLLLMIIGSWVVGRISLFPTSKVGTASSPSSSTSSMRISFAC